MKLFSVIIPTYKAEKYIAKTIKSVLAQTYSHFEIIVVDDESPDRSLAICQQFQDSRLKIISQKNRGLAGARNTGIRHAQGDYLAFLDADDLWLPEKLEKHLQHLESSPQIGISFSRSAFIDSEDRSIGTYQMPKLTNITAAHLLCRNPIGNGSAPVIRREVFADIKFQDNLYGTVEDFYFDESFRQSEDIECWIRIAIATNWQIEGIAEALTFYRVNSEGLSADITKQLISWEKVIEKTYSYAPELVFRWEKVARAYQLRYLARRAVRSKDGNKAVNLVNRSLFTHWAIVLSEPRRTLLTLSAAYLLKLLPLSLYVRMENVGLKVTGFTQQIAIKREQTNLNTNILVASVE
jgi:glycosyltransferase involved in cell wall biosynthesis